MRTELAFIRRIVKAWHERGNFATVNDFPPVYPRQSLRALPPPGRRRQTARGYSQVEGDPWASTRDAAAAVAAVGGGGDGVVAGASAAVAAGTAPSQ